MDSIIGYQAARLIIILLVLYFVLKGPLRFLYRLLSGGDSEDAPNNPFQNGGITICSSTGVDNEISRKCEVAIGGNQFEFLNISGMFEEITDVLIPTDEGFLIATVRLQENPLGHALIITSVLSRDTRDKSLELAKWLRASREE